MSDSPTPLPTDEATEIAPPLALADLLDAAMRLHSDLCAVRLALTEARTEVARLTTNADTLVCGIIELTPPIDPAEMSALLARMAEAAKVAGGAR